MISISDNRMQHLIMLDSKLNRLIQLILEMERIYVIACTKGLASTRITSKFLLDVAFETFI
jgi:hypothetical protein